MPLINKTFFLLLCFSYVLVANNNINIKLEPLQPIQKDNTLNQEKIKLGEKLFFDKRLSKDNSVSCATCHILEKGGADNLSKSFGIERKVGLMNTPTVLNSRFNFVQFWDGRVKTLEEQINGPIHNPVEMGTNWAMIITKLSKVPEYQEQFNKIYTTNITPNAIRDAIAEFERSLITPSRFDSYLLGDNSALSLTEKDGYALFKSYGCASCHQGKNVGGNFYEKLGVFKKYPNPDTKEHLGRYNLLKTEMSKYEFKVPSLRNIELTYPYMHDGSIHSLKKMIKIMGEYQLGRTIPNNDVYKIEAFLKTLTSEKLEGTIHE